MMFMCMWGYCAGCEEFISFNPDRVPSLRVEGKKEPICRNCFDRWNQIHRISKGLKPEELNPDAYSSQEVE